MIVALADIVDAIASGDAKWTAIAGLVLQDQLDDLAVMFPDLDFTAVAMPQTRTELVEALLRKLAEPTSLPTVAFALGKAPSLTTRQLDEMVEALERHVDAGDEEFVHQILIALENHARRLDRALVARLHAMGSARINDLRITRGSDA